MFPAPGDQTKNGTNPGRTHRFYTGKAVLPFGFGLSYTTFKYTVVAAPTTTLSLHPLRTLLAQSRAEGRVLPPTLTAKAPFVQYTVNVTNTGSVDADDAVLGFLTPPGAGQNGVPLQTLFGFERVHVKAGQTVTVSLAAGLSDFATVGVDGTHSALPGAYTVSFGVRETARHGMGFATHTHVLV